jgi:hypothetical protein
MMRVRASEVPRIASCPASIKPPEVEIADSFQSPEATIGEAVHKALKIYVCGGDVVDIEEIADEFDVEENQIAPLYHVGRQLISPYLPDIDILAVEGSYEASVDQLMLTGHPDIVGKLKGEDYLIIWDWKSSSPSARYEWQLKAYWALASEVHNIDEGTLCIGWLRNKIVDKITVGREDADEIWERLRWARRNPNKYNPGPDNCMFCPRRHECKAVQEMTASAARSLQSFDSDKEIAPEELASIYPLYQTVKKKIDEYAEALKTELKIHGSLPLPDGQVIRLDERERSKIDIEKAWNEILEEWDIHEPQDIVSRIGPALSVSKTKLLKLIQAERGQKGKARKQFTERLESVGAISKTTYETFVCEGEGNE